MTDVTKAASAWADAAPQELHDHILELVEVYAEKAHRPKPFEAGVSSVPVAGRVYGAKELRLLAESSLEFWLTTGRFNDAFEKGLREYIGVRHLLTCNSGSSANLLAVSSLTSHLLKKRRPLKPGDEVVTCATGFPTTVNPLLQQGLVPVFVDVDIPTYNIKSDRIEAAITDKTRAIVIAHTLGNPYDLGTVMEIAKKHDLFVMEDCCDALGATYNGQKVGTFGDVGTVSFYPAHHITMGEGGAVFANNLLIKRAFESIRDWGRDCYCAPGMDNTCGNRFRWKLGELPEGYDHKYTYSHLGYNLKITDMQAAVGLAQLDRIDDFVAARRDNFKALWSALEPYQNELILPEATPNSDPSWFGFPITVRNPNKVKRNELVQFLNEKKIGTRLLFGGNLIKQPYMLERNFRVHGDLTQSDRVMNDCFWIGVYPGINEEMVDYMVSAIGEFLGR